MLKTELMTPATKKCHCFWHHLHSDLLRTRSTPFLKPSRMQCMCPYHCPCLSSSLIHFFLLFFRHKLFPLRAYTVPSCSTVLLVIQVCSRDATFLVMADLCSFCDSHLNSVHWQLWLWSHSVLQFPEHRVPASCSSSSGRGLQEGTVRPSCFKTKWIAQIRKEHLVICWEMHVVVLCWVSVVTHFCRAIVE